MILKPELNWIFHIAKNRNFLLSQKTVQLDEFSTDRCFVDFVEVDAGELSDLSSKWLVWFAKVLEKKFFVIFQIIFSLINSESHRFETSL